jgi:hypothetical protein
MSRFIALPATGEAESARSAEPGEGFDAALHLRDPHPVPRSYRGITALRPIPFGNRKNPVPPERPAPCA